MGLLDKTIKIAAAVAAAGLGASAISKRNENDNKEGNLSETLNIPKGYSIQILNDTFELSEINAYYLESREYIYLPVYNETITESSFLHIRTHEYDFVNRYYPYASILNEKTKKLDFSNFKSDSVFLNITKDIVQTTSNAICDLTDYINNNPSNTRFVNCIDCFGKRFTANLQALPNRIIRNNNEITIDNIEGKFLNEAEVEIKMVPCLIIEADKYYYYFGDGINYANVSELYQALDNRVREVIAELNQQSTDNIERKETKTLSIEDRLKKVKDLYEQGLITKEDYENKIHDIMKEI